MSQVKKLNKAVILVESQPIHVGEVLQVLNNIQKYDLIYICITKGTIVMEITHVMHTWLAFMHPYLDRVKIAYVEDDFTSIMKDDLPELFKDCTYLTDSREIFVHLTTLDVAVELIPRAIGYHGIFLRTAYRQSKALNWLEQRFIKSATVEKI